MAKGRKTKEQKGKTKTPKPQKAQKDQNILERFQEKRS